MKPKICIINVLQEISVSRDIMIIKHLALIWIGRGSYYLLGIDCVFSIVMSTL